MEGYYLLKFFLYAYHSFEINGHTNDVHPHTWTISLYIKKTDYDTRFNDMEKSINNFIMGYENRVLNETPPFDNIPPTFENIGDFFYDYINVILAEEGVFLERLEIAENPTRSYVVTEYGGLDGLRKTDKIRVNLKSLGAFVKESIAEEYFPEMSRKNKERKKVNKKKEEPFEIESKPYDSTIWGNSEGIVSKTVLSFFLIGLTALLLWWYLTATGSGPWASDAYGHIFKGNLMYENMMEGHYYPLYTSLWYNGIQPYRYWAPTPYYVLALLQLLFHSTAVQAYTMFIVTVFIIGACGWLLWGIKEKRIFLGFLLGVLWFLLPDNLRVTFSEGNAPRIFISALFPYYMYFIWMFIEYRKKWAIIGVLLTMSLICMSHLMIAAMLGITVVIFIALYSLFNKRFSEGLLVIISMPLSVMLCGIWVYPALQGGMMSLNSEAASELMKSLTYPALQSLDFTLRFENYELYYFGLAVLIVAVIGAVTANRKSVPQFLTLIIIFLGTTTVFVPILSKLPLNQLLWMMRFTPAAYAIFLMGVFSWKNIKKPVIAVMLMVLFADSYISFKFLAYNAVPSSQMEEMLDSVIENTENRTAILDCSEFGSYPSYYLSAGEKKVDYMYGWAWQGAATASNIVNVNTALEMHCYDYMFDRCYESGCDTVLVAKHKVDEKYIPEFRKSAARVGYELVKEHELGYLYKKQLPPNFGVKSRYGGLAIGGNASLICLEFPDFQEASDIYIDNYTVEELCQYRVLYLSGFEYEDKAKAEEVLRQAAANGVKIVVDMNRVPNDPTTNRMTFLDVSAQPIKFKNKLPDLHFNNITYFPVTFKQEFKEWNTIYLENVYNKLGFSWFGSNKITFIGKDKSNMITYIGFNLFYHGIVNEDSRVRDIFATSIGELKGKLPDRTAVAIEKEIDYNEIYIKSPEKNVNVNYALLDAFETDNNISDIHDLLVVDEYETKITVTYPYLKKGMIVSIVGVVGAVIFIFFVFKKRDEKNEAKV